MDAQAGALPSFVGPRDIAEAVCVSIATVRRWVARGYLPAPMRLSRLYRWPRDQVVAWIATFFEELTNRKSQADLPGAMSVRGPGRGRVACRTSKGKRVWYGDWTDAQGKRHRKDLGGTRVQAESVLARLISDRDRERHGITDNSGLSLPLAQLMDRYAAEMALASQPQSVISRRRAADRMLAGIGARVVRDVTPVRVIAWCRQRYADGIATGTIRSELKTVRGALQLLVNTGLLDANPLGGVRPLPRKAYRAPHQRRALTEIEVTRLLAHARDRDRTGWGTPVAPLIQAMVQVGARYAELRRVRWCDLDVARRSLRLPAKITKNLKGRVLPIPADLIEVLASLRSYSAKVRGHEPIPDETIFVTRDGRPLVADGYMFRSRLRALYRGAGIELRDEDGRCVDVHALRHTFVTRLERAKVSPAVQRKLAGHASYQLTLEVYTHLIPEDARAAIEALPSLGVGSTVSTASDGGSICADVQQAPVALVRQLTLFPEPAGP